MRTPRPDLPPKIRVPFNPDWTPADVAALPVLPQLSTSVSAAESHRQCARLHWFQHGRGIKTPSSPAQAEGQAIHKDYETGALTHPSVALAVQDGILPRPGPGVEHEREFWRYHDEADVWVHGFMDVVVGADGTRRLLDLKSRGSAAAATRYATPPHVLHLDLQLGVYTDVLFTEDDPPQEKIPAGHVYLSRDAADPAALLVEIPHGGLDRFTSALRWEQIGRIHRDATSFVNLQLPQVPPTRQACGKFGGCPFRGICDAADAAQLLGGLSMSLNPPTNNGAAPVSIDQMLAARAAPVTAVDAKEIGLWSQARGGIVDCLLEKVGKGYMVRVKGEPEIVGAGTTPEQASLACLAAIPGKTAAPPPTQPPAEAPAPVAPVARNVADERVRDVLTVSAARALEAAGVNTVSDLLGKTEDDLRMLKGFSGLDLRDVKAFLAQNGLSLSGGIDMTPPPGEKPYSGKGRHPAWLKARIAAVDGLKADDATAEAAVSAPPPAPRLRLDQMRADAATVSAAAVAATATAEAATAAPVVTNVPVPLTAAAVAAPSVDAATALRKALAILRAAEAARRAAERAETEAAAGAEKARAAFEAWLSAD